MSPGFKLIVPCALALSLAFACAPDLDSLSAEYSATGGASGSGSSDEGGMDSVGGGPVIPAACDNKSKDTNESDVDCGGTSKCDRCAANASCTANRDCDPALFCKDHRCAEPTCTDKVQNQDETAVDCGGSCPACDLGVACSANSDCTGDYCADGVCGDHCVSETREADETDTDCGGSCSPCADKKKCSEASDCVSKVCSNNKCVPASCDDQVQNQDESDTDCGGMCSATNPCEVSERCNSAADCGSWICSAAGKCVADIVVDSAGIIDDFEDGDMYLPVNPALGGRVGNWYHYGDTTPTAMGTASVVDINRGASIKGIHEAGMGYTTWGSGVGADLHNSGTKGSTDASAYDSVTFWARADNSLAVTVVLPDVDTDPSGMKCDQPNNGCDHHYYKNVQVGTSWQRYTVAFADLVLETGASPAPTKFAPDAVVSVQFRMLPGTTYNLYLDDVAFLKTMK